MKGNKKCKTLNTPSINNKSNVFYITQYIKYKVCVRQIKWGEKEVVIKT